MSISFPASECPVLQLLCKDDAGLLRKFGALSCYFGKLLPEDFQKDEELDDLWRTAAAPEHRILMRTFARQLLRPYVNSGFATREVTVYGDVVNASNCLVSTNFTDVTDRMSLSAFKELICGKEFTKIKFLDMSANYLQTNDLQVILGIVTELCQLDKLIAGATLSLKNNYIHGLQDELQPCRKALSDLLGIHKLSFLDIRSNPFASIDCKEYFQRVEKDSSSTQKLIWIHQHYLDRPGWRTFYSSEDICDEVFQTHLKYFQENRVTH
jgi:hypothetical protein